MIRYLLALVEIVIFIVALAFFLMLAAHTAKASELPKGFTLSVVPPSSSGKTDHIGTPEITIQPPFAVAKVYACGAYIQLSGPATVHAEDNDTYLNVLADEIAKACKEFYANE